MSPSRRKLLISETINPDPIISAAQNGGIKRQT